MDLDDWKAHTEYTGGFLESSTLVRQARGTAIHTSPCVDRKETPGDSQVRWFWEAVQGMSNEERSKLLFFCTGSARPPASGFASLMGYAGKQQRFTMQRDDGDAGRLPRFHVTSPSFRATCEAARPLRECARKSAPEKATRGL